MAGLDGELDGVLKAMESSFHVRVIGTFAPDLIWAPAEAEAGPWLAQNYPDFDQFPVRQRDSTIGILPRHGVDAGKTVRQAMQPLSEGVIVSADMPIAELIPQLRKSHYRLILRGGRMDGLVTQSDLLKLPVRMLLFGLISHLELCLRALVRARAPWPRWLQLLEPERNKAVRSRVEDLRKARFELDPLEFSNFSDVVDVLAQQPDLGDGFREEANLIRILRNDIAHAKTYINSADDVCRFADRFTYIRDLIDRVSGMLKTTR
jgi:hypothetical protein